MNESIIWRHQSIRDSTRTISLLLLPLQHGHCRLRSLTDHRALLPDCHHNHLCLHLFLLVPGGGLLTLTLGTVRTAAPTATPEGGATQLLNYTPPLRAE